MPRPSLKASRTEEILDAFERCIIREGIAGTSLEAIAKEAQMKRSILRHYIGNRDELIVALGERWNKQYEEDWRFLIDLPDEGRLDIVLDVLFSESENDENTDSTSVIIGEALFAEAKRVPKLKLLMASWMDEFVTHIEKELEMAYPGADNKKRNSVAHGILAIYLMAESLKPMSLEGYENPLKASALHLVSSLS